MSNVTLRIGGRDYTMACAEGEEDHVSGLGRLIDSKLQSLAGNAGMSETRQLLFAALILADELHEAGGKPVSVPTSAPTEPAVNPARLEAVAERLEACAASFES